MRQKFTTFFSFKTLQLPGLCIRTSWVLLEVHRILAAGSHWVVIQLDPRCWHWIYHLSPAGVHTNYHYHYQRALGYLRWCPEYTIALAPQEDPTQTNPPGSHAVRTAFHKMERFVGVCTVERCYQPMVVFLSPEVEITDLTVVHTCTRGPSRMPDMLLVPNAHGGSGRGRRSPKATPPRESFHDQVLGIRQLFTRATPPEP